MKALIAVALLACSTMAFAGDTDQGSKDSMVGFYQKCMENKVRLAGKTVARSDVKSYDSKCTVLLYEHTTFQKMCLVDQSEVRQNTVSIRNSFLNVAVADNVYK